MDRYFDLSVADVAGEYAAFDERLGSIPSVEHRDHDWPLIHARRRTGEPAKIIVGKDLEHTVASFASLLGRLLDDGESEGRRADAVAGLRSFRQGKVALFDDDDLEVVDWFMARTVYSAVLRFLVGDACLALAFHASEDVLAVCFDRTRPLPLNRSAWLTEPREMDRLLTFVRTATETDPDKPSPLLALSGVSLFLLMVGLWEYELIIPEPNLVSDEIADGLWATEAVEQWRQAGGPTAGFEWALRTLREIRS